MSGRFALGGDKKLDMRRLRQHVPDFVLDLAVFLRDALAEVHELEPRFDEIAFFEPAERGHVLEYAPGERAVAPSLLAELVDRAQEAFPVLRVDPVLDLHQDRAAIVVDGFDGRREPVVKRRGEIDLLGVLQLPAPGRRDGVRARW